MAAHGFFIDDLRSFLDALEGRGYREIKSGETVGHAKVLSGALMKTYTTPGKVTRDDSVPVHVDYELVNHGKPLLKLIKELKQLNLRYKKSLPGWKTKRDSRKEVRRGRWLDLQRFLHRHQELVDCYKHEPVEGTLLFDLQVVPAPREQGICLQFIKALAEALSPHGIIRGRREADEVVEQRNGWIKRFTKIHRQRGWEPRQIIREIQKNIQSGEWDERSKLQYNLANSTVCKIAGIKINRPGGRSNYSSHSNQESLP